MVIVIEGGEATGKTSLARLFSKELSIPVIHFGVPPEEGVFDHFFRQFDLAYTKHKNIILDRFHLSNFAYAGCLGGGVLTMPEWFRLDEILAAFESCLFLLVDDPFVIEKRLQEKDQGDRAHQLSREEIGAIQARMFDGFRMSQIGVKGSYQYRQFVDEEGERTEQLEYIVKRMRELIR